ncbi:MAG: transcriptional repressor [Oscillospiraceae bacterium]|nr:transcriptional repressor [Oscillospiraceae bacterium]
MPARKHSKKRDAILECVRSTTTHPSAEWVYAQLKPDIPDLSLGTVYRNLALFKQEGIIGSMGVVDGMERFEGNTQPHAHFVCSHCSAVIDVDDVDPPQHRSEQVPCGSVRDCVLTFTGICNNCVSVDAQH